MSAYSKEHRFTSCYVTVRAEATESGSRIRTSAGATMTPMQALELVQSLLEAIAACPAQLASAAVDRAAAAEIMAALAAEVERQDAKHGPYEGTRLGRSRLALATLEDEVAEALEAWRQERAIRRAARRGGGHWPLTRDEVLQVAAVAVRALRDAL